MWLNLVELAQAPDDRLLQLLAQGAWDPAFAHAEASGLSADFVYRCSPVHAAHACWQSACHGFWQGCSDGRCSACQRRAC